MFGNVRPDETVDLYFNLSKDGQLDTRGPWNTEPVFKYVEIRPRKATRRRK